MSSKVDVVKHADLHWVSTTTYGLLLIGVPITGLRHGQLNAVVKGRANERFINDLLIKSNGEPSQFLSSPTREFAELDKRRQPPFEIVSYYETNSSPTAVVGNTSHRRALTPILTLVTGLGRLSCRHEQPKGTDRDEIVSRACWTPVSRHRSCAKQCRPLRTGQVAIVGLEALAEQHALAGAYRANGQVREAVEPLEHVVAVHKEALAEDHPDRLVSQHALARAYRANGQMEEAVELLQHVVATKQCKFRKDH